MRERLHISVRWSLEYTRIVDGRLKNCRYTLEEFAFCRFRDHRCVSFYQESGRFVRRPEPSGVGSWIEPHEKISRDSDLFDCKELARSPYEAQDALGYLSVCRIRKYQSRHDGD